LNAVIDDGESYLVGEADAVGRELVTKARCRKWFRDSRLPRPHALGARRRELVP
jgi:hypothetical protein